MVGCPSTGVFPVGMWGSTLGYYYRGLGTCMATPNYELAGGGGIPQSTTGDAAGAQGWCDWFPPCFRRGGSAGYSPASGYSVHAGFAVNPGGAGRAAPAGGRHGHKQPACSDHPAADGTPGGGGVPGDDRDKVS